jgi:ATP-dependent exoDNAse (exonuclease V) alpha subunit
LDQETALSILKSGHNVYLTGSAGTGKTYLINQYIEYLRARQVPVAVTASTGIAATHIGGQTIHSWSAIGIRDHITMQDLDKISKNKQTRERLEKTHVLIIDEISMLSGKILTGISEILKHFKRSELPFGGTQVIFSGDFFQLPPVSREALSNREKFAFMAPVWVEARLKVCYLTKQYRQGQDALAIVLDEVRNKSVSDDSISLIQDKLQETTTDSEVLKLYTHNADVDAMNEKRLAANPNKLYTFVAQGKGNPKLVENLRNSVLAAPTIGLKMGAKVMFVRNNPEKGYHNGSIGTVEGFDGEDNWPKVQLHDGRWIIATPEEWTVVDENENILASYQQVPLRLAWAITIHKSQGMTLDAAEIDLSKTFETGQGYVALSRLKNWNGLYLRGINNTALAVDDLAYKADVRFKELSEEAEDGVMELDEHSLKLVFENFVKKCGGTNDKKLIAENKSREKKLVAKIKKESTYLITKKLVEEGKSIDAMAKEREFSVTTIISHLERLKKDDETINLDQYKPESHILTKVEKVSAKLRLQGNEEFFDKDGNLKLSTIFGALNGDLDFEQIRMARLFLA